MAHDLPRSSRHARHPPARGPGLAAHPGEDPVVHGRGRRDDRAGRRRHHGHVRGGGRRAAAAPPVPRFRARGRPLRDQPLDRRSLRRLTGERHRLGPRQRGARRGRRRPHRAVHRQRRRRALERAGRDRVSRLLRGAAVRAGARPPDRGARHGARREPRRAAHPPLLAAEVRRRSRRRRPPGDPRRRTVRGDRGAAAGCVRAGCGTGRGGGLEAPHREHRQRGEPFVARLHRHRPAAGRGVAGGARRRAGRGARTAGRCLSRSEPGLGPAVGGPARADRRRHRAHALDLLRRGHDRPARRVRERGEPAAGSSDGAIGRVRGAGGPRGRARSAGAAAGRRKPAAVARRRPARPVAGGLGHVGLRRPGARVDSPTGRGAGGRARGGVRPGGGGRHRLPVRRRAGSPREPVPDARRRISRDQIQHAPPLDVRGGAGGAGADAAGRGGPARPWLRPAARVGPGLRA